MKATSSVPNSGRAVPMRNIRTRETANDIVASLGI